MTSNGLFDPAFIEERKAEAAILVTREDPGKQDEQFVKAQEGSCKLGETVDKPVAASPQLKPPSTPTKCSVLTNVSGRKIFINSSLPRQREKQSKETHTSQYDLAKLLLRRVFLKSHEGTLYLFDGRIYRVLSEDDAKR